MLGEVLAMGDFQKMLQFEFIREEFYSIQRNCRNKKMVFDFKLNLNENLLNILKKLNESEYVFGKYRIFIIREPKYRIIMSENMPDKIVNHLVSTHILLPNLEKRLIATNVATRRGKGTKYGFDAIVKYINTLSLHKKEIYVLKIDMKKYFYNINHDILLDMLKRYITDSKSFNILIRIIDSTNLPYLNSEINRLKEKEIKWVNNLNISSRKKRLKLNKLRTCLLINLKKVYL